MRLRVDISAHGFGHLAQVAPVLNALAAGTPDLDAARLEAPVFRVSGREVSGLELPGPDAHPRDPQGLEISVQSALPRQRLATRLRCPFTHLARATDLGMAMRDALNVEIDESLQAHLDFHADWEDRVAAEAAQLREDGVDAVLSDVSYLALAAAAAAGIPAVALSSLHWAGVFEHYCGDRPGAAAVLEDMNAAYAGARAFLRLTPAMPMPGLANAVDVGPVADAGRERRAELRDALGLSSSVRLVLVSLGGLPFQLDFTNWPRLKGVFYLAQRGGAHPQLLDFGSLGWAFPELLAASDVLLTKPGYGSFVEAATAGVAVLSLPRRDWPEEPHLSDWLDTHGRLCWVERSDLTAGTFGPELEALLGAPRPPRVAPTGVAEAVAQLRDCFDMG